MTTVSTSRPPTAPDAPPPGRDHPATVDPSTAGQPTAGPSTAGQPSAGPSTADVVGRLELAFRLLGKRVYLPGLRALRERAPGAGVDKASFPLLALLEEHDEVRPSDAATALDLDLSTVSRQVRHLEAAGLVARRPDADDGRACRVRLTETGRDGLTAVRRTRSELLDAALADWPSHDRGELLRLLDLLVGSLRDAGPATPPAPSAGEHPHAVDTRARTRPHHHDAPDHDAPHHHAPDHQALDHHALDHDAPAESA